MGAAAAGLRFVTVAAAALGFVTVALGRQQSSLGACGVNISSPVMLENITVLAVA